MKAITLFVAAFALTSSLMAEPESFCPRCPVENEFHILERLSVSFPEGEENNWHLVTSNEREDGRVFEIWKKENNRERLVIVTSPWGEEGTLNAVEAIDTIAGCFKDEIEVLRRTKSEDEIAIALHLRDNWTFVRVITSPYALHIVTWGIDSEEVDPEIALQKLDGYAQIVY